MPAREEPVNETIATSGCPDRCVPTPAPSPLTRLNTPGGTFASCRMSANSIADSGDSSEGLSTIVQPVAIAGMTFSAIWFIGQFQGVISAQTPIGSYRIRSSGVSGRSSRSNSKPSSASMNDSMW